jgi:hypothetical protein
MSIPTTVQVAGPQCRSRPKPNSSGAPRLGPHRRPRFAADDSGALEEHWYVGSPSRDQRHAEEQISWSDDHRKVILEIAWKNGRLRHRAPSQGGLEGRHFQGRAVSIFHPVI